MLVQTDNDNVTTWWGLRDVPSSERFTWVYPYLEKSGQGV